MPISVEDIMEGLAKSHPNVTTIKSPDETYRYAMPQAAMYGWLGDKARTLGAPLGWAYTGLLAMFASFGVPIEGPGELRPNIYVAHLADKGVGKSRTQDRIRRSLSLHDYNTVVETVPGSDRGLYEMFPEEVDRSGQVLPAVSRLLLQDEMRQLLNKVAIRGSSLGQTLCTLYGRDEASGAIKNGTSKARVRLSILGAVKAANLDEFREVFGAETTAGLTDRFVLVPGPPRWNWDDLWTANLESRAPYVVQVPAYAFERVKLWRQVPHTSRGRLGEIVLKVAVLSASANYESTIRPECLDAAIAFGEWQEQVRLGHQPGEARNDDAALGDAMMLAIQEEYAGSGSDWVKFSPLAARKNWHRKYGAPAVNRVRKALAEAELILELTSEDGKTKLGKVKPRNHGGE